MIRSNAADYGCQHERQSLDGNRIHKYACCAAQYPETMPDNPDI